MNEIRKLFHRLVLAKTHTATTWLTMHWHRWRTQHQNRARISHYQARTPRSHSP